MVTETIGKVEAIINADGTLLQGSLAQALMNLKQQRPDLFILTGPEQLGMLTKLFFENVLR